MIQLIIIVVVVLLLIILIVMTILTILITLLLLLLLIMIIMILMLIMMILIILMTQAILGCVAEPPGWLALSDSADILSYDDTQEGINMNNIIMYIIHMYVCIHVYI